MANLDEVNLNIISLLSKDAQTPFYKIAEQLGISPRTVELRFRKLVEKRIIIGSTIRIDIGKIGFVGKSYIHITTSQDANKSLLNEQLKKINGIFLTVEIIGNYDILALLAVKDLASTFKVIEHIRKLPNVEKVDVSFVNDTIYPMSRWVNKQMPLKRTRNQRCSF
jgi:Lrp/AsnC family transcriptional regulator, regulator for asnA, asnC and gidA